MKTYDTVVIGAGIAGLSIARELAKRGERVLVLEREIKGGTASRAAAGLIDPYTEATVDTPVLQLGMQAFELYPSFLDELGPQTRQEVEFKKTGILYLIFSKQDEAYLLDRFEWQKKYGFPVESLSAEQVKKLEPAVSKKVEGGVFYPEIPKVNAGKLTEALFQAARSQGVEILTSVQETTIWTEQNKIKGVKTSQGSFEAKAVVVAAGSWSGLDSKLGIEMKISPVRGQILIMRAPATHYPQHILHTTRYAYIVPWPENRILVGSTLESAGYDNRVTPEGKKYILDRASEIIEEIHSFPIEKEWAGLRPRPERELPFIGPTRTPGLFCAVGYYRAGILMGPVVGKLMAEGIHSGNFSPLLEPFLPEVEIKK